MQNKLKFAGLIVILLITFIAGMSSGPSITEIMIRDNTDDANNGQSGTWYISQMHPWIIQPQPGSCPICGMDLTPVDPDRFAGEMTIDPVVIQNMGVRIAESETGTINRNIRTVGTVTIDPSKVSDINLRFTGWVEKIHVHAQWDLVKQGDPLLDIYSPEVFSAEKEFSIALQSTSSNKSALVKAAKQRLRLLGLPNNEIMRLEKGGAAKEIVTLTAPHSGIVLKKSVNSGSKISPQTLAYQIADLSQIWVEATVYEQHLPFIHLNQSARVKLDYGTNKIIEGKISYIYPIVDRTTRETKARFVFQNEDGHLKPDMFATVEIVSETKPMVKVPREAVIGTGERNIVFVSLGRGRFEPRKVETGPYGNGYIGITEGLTPGEKVVISGQFLLDSESKMREALSKVMKGDLASQQKIEAPAGNTIEISLDTKPTHAFKQALDSYLLLQQSLYKDDPTLSGSQLDQFIFSYKNFYNVAKESDAHIHHKVPSIENIFKYLNNLTASNLNEIRVHFGEIGPELDLIIKAIGAPSEFAGNLTGMKCSMAKGIREGGIWIQFGPDVQNPFFGIGNDMRDCAADTWGFQQQGGDSEQHNSQNKTEPKIDSKTHMNHSDKLPANLTKDMLTAYSGLHTSLYHNDLPKAREFAQRLLKATENTQQNMDTIQSHTHGIIHASDLKAARISLGSMSLSFKAILEKNPANYTGLYVMKCGMARGIPEKGIWIQSSPSVENPYFGQDHGMSDCAIEILKITKSGLVEIE